MLYKRGNYYVKLFPYDTNVLTEGINFFAIFLINCHCLCLYFPVHTAQIIQYPECIKGIVAD